MLTNRPKVQAAAGEPVKNPRGAVGDEGVGFARAKRNPPERKTGNVREQNVRHGFHFFTATTTPATTSTPPPTMNQVASGTLVPPFQA